MVRPLRDLGVGIGVALHHRGTWHAVPDALVKGGVDVITVEAADLVEPAIGVVSEERVSTLVMVCGGSLDRVTVAGVDQTSFALELSSAGLPRQSGSVHGEAMSSSDLHDWVLQRNR
jgi:hypothetical protein